MLYQVQKENVVGTHPTHTYYPAMYQLIPHIISMIPLTKNPLIKGGKQKVFSVESQAQMTIIDAD